MPKHHYATGGNVRRRKYSNDAIQTATILIGTATIIAYIALVITGILPGTT